MCQIMENLNRMAVEEALEECKEGIVLKLLKNNEPIAKIAELIDLPEEKVSEIQQKAFAQA